MESDIIKRAFELAPECTKLEELRLKLNREGYIQVEAHLLSGSLRRELMKLLKNPR